MQNSPDAHRCSHVGRRRLVGGRGAPGPAGPRGHRTVDAAVRPERRARAGRASASAAAARSTISTTRDASPRASASRTTSSTSSEQFAEQVISNFVREYSSGRTPIPCVHCNGDLKFATLAERAGAMEAEFVATGHYARVDLCPATGRYRLLRGVDPVEGSVVFPLHADAGPALARDVPRRRARQGRGA